MWLDDLIGYFDPEEKLRRIRARTVTETLKRSYDGASKGRRTEGWKARGLSANAEIAPALPLLRDRSRDLVRNDAYAARGVMVIPANVVGKGIRAAITSENDKIEETTKMVWHNWAETSMCDYDGRSDYYGLQYLALRSLVESGEVLIRRRQTRQNKDEIPLKLQILEADFIASDYVLNQSAVKGGNKIIQGIEFDSMGRRVAYHLYESHPGNHGIDTQRLDSSFKTIRVSASDILHLYRVDRPGQVRGVPWLAPAMLRLKDFGDYEQAQLLRQKLAACYMAFVKDTEIPEFTKAEEDLLRKFEPGLIEYLPPGKDVTLASPPEVSENYAEYTRVMLQAVATALGVSYEALTGNLKDINFSSSRMGWLEFQRNIEAWRCQIMNMQFNNPIWGWFVDAAEMVGIEATKTKVTWTAPRREMIDPAKEVPAIIDSVNAKLKTMSEVIRENGKNPEDHFKELKAEKDLLDSLGITIENENSSSNNSSVDSSNDDD